MTADNRRLPSSFDAAAAASDVSDAESVMSDSGGGGSPLVTSGGGSAMRHAQRNISMFSSALRELERGSRGRGRGGRGRGGGGRRSQWDATADGGARQQRQADREDRLYLEDADANAPGTEDTETWRDSPEYERFLRELGPGSGPERCFGCIMAKDPRRVAPVCADGLNKMMDMVRACAGADKITLARDLVQLFETSVRTVANRAKRAGEQECPAWAAADIYEHFFTQEHRRLDALASLEQRIVYYEEALSRMNRHYVYTDIHDERGVPRRVPDPKRLRESLAISMYLDKLYAIKPANMALASTDGPELRRTDAFQRRPTYSALPYIGGGGGGTSSATSSSSQSSSSSATRH